MKIFANNFTEKDNHFLNDNKENIIHQYLKGQNDTGNTLEALAKRSNIYKKRIAKRPTVKHRN